MIRPDETEIRGTWVERGGGLEADENCRRIDRLLRTCLKEIGRDGSGWDILYLDPCDGRYWELIYPDSHLQGGGPPLLRHLTEAEVRRRYKLPELP